MPFGRLPEPVEVVPEVREWGELIELLWVLNASVFHPRGFIFGLAFDDAGKAVGWTLKGTGDRPFTYPDEPWVRECFDAAERVLQHQPF